MGVSQANKVLISKDAQPWISVDHMTKNPARKNEKRFRIHETLNIAAWNVRSIGNKESELVGEIETKGINIAVISETKNKLKGTKMIGSIQWSFPRDPSPIRHSFNNQL
jgi:hypothetical protein